MNAETGLLIFYVIGGIFAVIGSIVVFIENYKSDHSLVGESKLLCSSGKFSDPAAAGER